MLKSIRNPEGIIEITFTNIGLMIATGVLLLAAYSFMFENSWQKKNEMQTIAQSFVTVLNEMDVKCFENTTWYTFPDMGYPYKVSLSMEYITITAQQSMFQNEVTVRKQFFSRPWLRTMHDPWGNKTEFHIFLRDMFGNAGTTRDPVQNITAVKKYLATEWNSTTMFFTVNPVMVDVTSPLIIEKICVYYDDNQDGIWVKGEEKQSFVIIGELIIQE